MTRADDTIFWKPASSKYDWPNSLTDAVMAAPDGALVVYRQSKPNGLSGSTPPINRVAASVATNLKCALVQWPEKPCEGKQSMERVWCYAIQKPRRAA